MFNRLKKLFKKSPPVEEFDEVAAQKWYEHKKAVMEKVMGPQHAIVMHAIIPYAIGGGLDLYYYPNGIPGTVIATMEASESAEQGSTNDAYARYELAMFTKHPLNLDDAKNLETPFGKAHSNINSILNCVVPYSATARLNGNDTCEFPADMEKLGGKCLIFLNYGPETKSDFGVVAVMEIFRSEMDFAREHGTEKLVEKLKAAGHYPYSDLDREPLA